MNKLVFRTKHCPLENSLQCKTFQKHYRNVINIFNRHSLGTYTRMGKGDKRQT